MRAAVLRGVGQPLVLEQRPEPVGPDVIDVIACGACHSDLHVVDGAYPSPLPLVLGHEVTGMHAESGPVMVYAPWGCRSCAMCESGQEMLCPTGKEIALFQDGGYTERFAVQHLGLECPARRAARHRPPPTVAGRDRGVAVERGEPGTRPTPSRRRRRSVRPRARP